MHGTVESSQSPPLSRRISRGYFQYSVRPAESVSEMYSRFCTNDKMRPANPTLSKLSTRARNYLITSWRYESSTV